MILGGCSLDEVGYREMLRTFWTRYRHIRPDLDIYNHPEWDWSTCLPMAVHGDEGRGTLRRPIMIPCASKGHGSYGKSGNTTDAPKGHKHPSIHEAPECSLNLVHLAEFL